MCPQLWSFFSEASTNAVVATSYDSRLPRIFASYAKRLTVKSCLETLHKILSRHLLDLACQLQFKQRCEDFIRRNGRLKLFHQLIDVRDFVSLEPRKKFFFLRMM